MTMDTLKDRVEAFAQLRDAEAKAKKALEAAEQRFREENVDLIQQVRLATELRTQLEQAIRDETRMEFLSTGDKTPAPGVGIRLNKRLEYDPAEALAWARMNHACLLLDKKEFEKIGRGLDIVREVAEPVVTIATSLYAAFQEADREEKARAAA